MNKLVKLAEQNIGTIEQLFDQIRELSQNRSNYALEKFVVGAQDMPARQRKQILDELLSLLEGLKQVTSEIKLAEIDVEEMQYKIDNKIGDSFEIRRMEVRLNERQQAFNLLDIRLIGLMREGAFLLGMLQKIPEYTREQYEAEETEYWHKRLTRQFFMAERGGGVNQGNLDAIHQMFSAPGIPRISAPIDLPQIMALLGYEVKKIEDKNETI